MGRATLVNVGGICLLCFCWGVTGWIVDPQISKRIYQIGEQPIGLPKNGQRMGNLLSLSMSATNGDDSSLASEEKVISDESSVQSIKNSLLRLSLVGGRGVWSRSSERAAAASLVEQLEQQKQKCRPENSAMLTDGTWELILSDVEPFRASVFFLALAEAVEANIQSDASDGALTVHSLATGGGEVGRVAHVIENNGKRLHSLVELKSGSVPSLPLALTGTVISSGELSPANDENDNSMFSLTLKNTTVQGNKVKYGLPSEGGLKPGIESNVLSWIGDQLVPSGDIFSSILDPIGGGQTALLELSYADDDMMVWRTPRLSDHYFLFLRGDPDAWPAMEELRSKESKLQQSPIGSAFALGMLNPFFSRRAGANNR